VGATRGVDAALAGKVTKVDSCSWRFVGEIAAGGWIALDALLGRPDEHGR
jgi:hypothetical protein